MPTGLHMAPDYFRDPCCFVSLRYVILKFLRVNLFLWGHELANSFLLFRVHKYFLQMIKIFSGRHRLHFLLGLSCSLQFLSTFPCTWKDLLPSLRVHTCLDSSVSFFLFACWKDVKWFLYSSLKSVATESNVWFCCCPSRYSRLVNQVLSEAITVKKPECPLEGNCLQPTNFKERCRNHLTSLKLWLVEILLGTTTDLLPGVR